MATPILPHIKHVAEKGVAGLIAGMNNSFSASAGGENRLAFYDIDKTYPSLRLLDQNYSIIREEMEGVLNYRDRIPRYHDLSKRETYISGTVDPDKNWRVYLLYTLLGIPESHKAKCPQTVALLQQIPNIVGAFFSILDPGKSIPAHCGEYHGYLRYHLGLRVPKNDPPSMRVKDQLHTWEEGKSILFDDSWNHEVYNKSDDLRVVLLVDVLRPMPPHLHAINWCTNRLFTQSPEAKQALKNIKKYS